MAPKRRKSKKSNKVGSFRGRRLANRFTHRYGPDVLAAHGPLVLAAWHAPEPLQDALAREGKRVPEPVEGALLLDTGATATCISEHAAERLSLPTVGLRRTHGAGGTSSNPVVLATLMISIADRETSRTLAFTGPAVVVPGLERSSHDWGLAIRGESVSLIGLLGRDILRHTTFQYNGKEGKLTLTFDREWIQALEKAGQASSLPS